MRLDKQWVVDWRPRSWPTFPSALRLEGSPDFFKYLQNKLCTLILINLGIILELFDIILATISYETMKDVYRQICLIILK